MCCNVRIILTSIYQNKKNNHLEVGGFFVVVKLVFGTIFSVVYFGSLELSSILLGDKLPLVFVRTFSFLYDYTRLICLTAYNY